MSTSRDRILELKNSKGNGFVNQSSNNNTSRDRILELKNNNKGAEKTIQSSNKSNNTNMASVLEKMKDVRKPKTKEEINKTAADLRKSILEGEVGPTNELKKYAKSYPSKVAKEAEAIGSRVFKLQERAKEYDKEGDVLKNIISEKFSNKDYLGSALGVGLYAQNRFGRKIDLVGNITNEAFQFVLAPITPAIGTLIESSIDSTGGDDSIIKSGLDTIDNIVGYVSKNLTENLGVKEEGAKGATEGLLGVASIPAGALVGNVVRKTTRGAIYGLGTVSNKINKYRKFSKTPDDGINSTLIKTDLTNESEVKLSEGANIKDGVSNSIKKINNVLDRWTSALTKMNDAKIKGDGSIDTSVNILKEEGFDGIVKFVEEDKNNILKDNYIKTTINQLDNTKTPAIIKGENPETISKINEINILEGEGVIKFNGEKDGNYSFSYADDLELNSEVSRAKEFLVEKEVYKKINESEPAQTPKTQKEKIQNIMKGNELEVRGLNDAFNRIGKDKTAEYDFIAYAQRIDERYSLGMRKQIDNLADNFDIETARMLTSDISDRKAKFFFGDKNYMATEITSLKQKLGIEQNIVNTAFKAGVKEGSEKSKLKYNQTILKEKEKFNARIEKLKAKMKSASEKQKAILKERIENIRANHKRKLDEIKADRDGVKYAVTHVYEASMRALKDNRYKGAKISKFLKELKVLGTKSKITKAQLTKTINNILKELHTTYSRNLISAIKKEASVIKKFKKSTDASERKKYSALFTVMGDLQEVYNKVLLANKNGMPIEQLETILTELRLINEASKNYASLMKDIRGTDNGRIVGGILSENKKGFNLFGDGPQSGLRGLKDELPSNAGFIKRVYRKFFEDRALKLAALGNFSLYWVSAARLMSGGSKAFMKEFVYKPIEKLNEFILKRDELNKNAVQYYKDIEEYSKESKTDIEENMNSLGFYAAVNRKVEMSDGSIAWIGAENHIASMYEVNGVLKSEFKVSEKRKAELMEMDRPESLAQMPDVIWETLRGTRGHEWYLRVDNSRLKNTWQSMIDDFREIGEGLQDVAAEYDGVVFQKNINYFPLKVQNGGDLIQDIGNKRSASISDNFINSLTRNTSLRGGANYEYNAMKTYALSGGNQLYYMIMKPVLERLKDLYTGMNMNKSSELRDYGLIRDDGMFVYNKEVLNEKGLLVYDEKGKLANLEEGKAYDLNKMDLSVRSTGLNTKFGEIANSRMLEFLDRIANNGIKASDNEFTKFLYNANILAAGTALSFNFSPVLKQSLSYIDAGRNFDLGELSNGIKLASGDIEINGKKMSMGEYIQEISPAIRNRTAGQSVMRDLKNSKEIQLFGITRGIKNIIDYGLKPMQAFDKVIAEDIFMSAYAQQMKKIKPGITDAEIRLLNNKEAVSEANARVIEIMSTGDDILTSPMMGSMAGKIFLSLTGTQQNRFGKFLVDFAGDVEKTNLMKAIMANSWFVAGNVVEAVMSYYIAYLRFELGMSAFDIETKYQDEALWKQFISSQVKQVPVLSLFNDYAEGGQVGFARAGKQFYDGFNRLTDDKDSNDIDGLVKILKGIGLGDIANSINLLK